MPLSKQRNRDRMREIRLHKHLYPPYQAKTVQPKPLIVLPDSDNQGITGYDADGNPLYDD